MFFPAADTIAFSEGGVEAMRLDSAGNMGIGTVTPSYKLSIAGASATSSNILLTHNTDATGAYSRIRFQFAEGNTSISSEIRNIQRAAGENGASLAFLTDSSTGALTDRLRITSQGFVGINTTSPASTLQINATTEWGTRLLFAGDTPTARCLYLTQRARGSFASPTTVTTDTIIGGLDAGGYNSSAYTLGFNGGASIQLTAEATWTTISNPTYMAFFTNSVGAAGYAERMRINSSGALVFAGGNTAATGTGIAFPATQSASSDANTLDDYEEGTWTTTVTPTLNTTGTPTLSNARYTKIGNLVTLEGTFSAQVTSSNQITYWVFTIPFATAALASGACGAAKQEANYIVGAVSDSTGSSSNTPYISYSASAALPSGTANHSFSYTYIAA
jgi:hypothetical protein